MRTFKTNLLGLALAGLILGACSQTATYETADLMNEQAAAEKGGFNLSPFGMNGENANIDYEYEGNFFSYSEQDACLDEPMTVRFDIGQRGIDCGTVRIDIWRPSDADWVPNFAEGAPEDGYFEFTYTPTEIGETKFRGTYSRVKIDGTWCGNNINGFTGLDDDYLNVVECPECDPGLFTYVTADNQNITFKYNHDEEVQSLTLEFTFPQVLNLPLNIDGKYVAPDGKIYSVNNPTNQTNFTWTGAVSCKASEAATFVFAMTADCSAPPANDGQAIIWTDAKVTAVNGVTLVDNLETLDVNEGPYSLKGNLSNIVFTGCPVNP